MSIAALHRAGLYAHIWLQLQFNLVYICLSLYIYINKKNFREHFQRAMKELVNPCLVTLASLPWCGILSQIWKLGPRTWDYWGVDCSGVSIYSHSEVYTYMYYLYASPDKKILQELWLESFGSNKPCALCCGNSTTIPWRHLCPTAAWVSTIYNQTTWLASHNTQHPLIVLATIWCLTCDLLHCKYLGTDDYFLGSVLWLLCYIVLPGEPDFCARWYKYIYIYIYTHISLTVPYISIAPSLQEYLWDYIIFGYISSAITSWYLFRYLWDYISAAITSSGTSLRL